MKQPLDLNPTLSVRFFLAGALALCLLLLNTGNIHAQSQGDDDDDDDDDRGMNIIITIDPDDDFFTEEDWDSDGERERDRDHEDHGRDEDWRSDRDEWEVIRDLRDLDRDDLDEEELKRLEEELEKLEELEDLEGIDLPRRFRLPRRPRIGRDREHYSDHVRIKIGDDDGRIVRIGRDLRVRENEIIESAVVLFGNLIVEGEIEDDALVIGGHLEVAEDAVIDGDAVVIGGSLDIDRDGYVRGEKAQIGHVGPLAFAFDVGPHGDRGNGIKRFIFTSLLLFIALFLAWLIYLLIGDRLQVMSGAIQFNFWRNLGIGLVIALLWLPVGVLFAITVIGIPVFLVLFLAAPLVGFVGYLAGAHALGRRVAAGVRFERQSSLGYLMVGMISIATLFLLANMMGILGSLLVPVAFGFKTAGVILATLMATVGVGAILTTRFGRVDPDPDGLIAAAPDQPVPPPLPAVPVTPAPTVEPVPTVSPDSPPTTVSPVPPIPPSAPESSSPTSLPEFTTPATPPPADDDK